MSTAEKRRYSAKEYLAFERASEIKHEYYQGEIRLMPPADYQHCLLVSNMVFLLARQLKSFMMC